MVGAIVSVAALMACEGCETPDPPDMPEDPTATSCAEFRTREACFEGGCSFFVTTFKLVDPATLEDQDMETDFDDEDMGMRMRTEGPTCARGTPSSLCVLADSLEGPNLLTWYQRTLDDGTKETTQLKVDVNLEGWTRCGYEDVPPDCDCDGVP